jgi:hypothetical protein
MGSHVGIRDDIPYHNLYDAIYAVPLSAAIEARYADVGAVAAAQ